VKRKLDIAMQRRKLRESILKLVEQGDVTGLAIALSAVSMLSWVMDDDEETVTAEISTTLNRLRVSVDQELAERLRVLAAPEQKA
jgi:hypothetical protein